MKPRSEAEARRLKAIADFGKSYARMVEDARVDGDVTCHDRANWAAIGLKAFAIATGTEDESYDLQLADLLCDLMHFAGIEGVFFDEALRVANANYLEEVAEEGVE